MASSKRPADDVALEAELERAKKPREDLPVINIDPRGNLVIAVGSEKTRDKKTRLVRVNSALLMAASPVFSAMLGPNFKEGQTVHDVANPLALPEDEPLPIIGMFHLMHFSSQNVHVGNRGLVQLFIVCEKYQVQERFPDFFRAHMPPTEGLSPTSRIELCIIAASVGVMDRFREYSAQLINSTRKTVLETCHKDLLARLADSSLDDLAVCRQYAHLQSTAAANIFAQKMMTATACKGVNFCIIAWFSAVWKSQPGKFDQDTAYVSLDKVLARADLANLEKALGTMRCDKAYGTCKACGQDKMIAAAMDAVRAKAKSDSAKNILCYHCFREGRIILQGKCSPHTGAWIPEELSVMLTE